MVKYTHTVTLEAGPEKGLKFKCAIVGEYVYCSEFIKQDGSIYADQDAYRHSSDIENLTPELWYDDPKRWSVKKLNQFKGNRCQAEK